MRPPRSPVSSPRSLVGRFADRSPAGSSRPQWRSSERHPARGSNQVAGPHAVGHWLGAALVGLVVLGLAFVPSSVWAGELQAGAATSNITPPLGADIIGGFTPYPATHVHDELHARCLVLDNGTHRLAIVVCDLLGLHYAVSREARRLITQHTGLPPGQVLICATHTHTAASALGPPGYLVEIELDEYQRFVAGRIADGVRRAIQLLRPAELAWGRVSIPEHVFNRRWHLRAGAMTPNPFGELDLVRMNPPAGSDTLVEPAGPVDPDLTFLAVREAGGAPLALWASYSLHYVGGERRGDISADYYGLFCEELARLMTPQPVTSESLPTPAGAPPFVAMLSNGTSGDVNNINFRQPRAATGPYVRMRDVAHDVARKVHQATEGLEWSRSVALDSRYRELSLARREPTAERRQWATEVLARAPADRGKWDLPTIYADRVLKLSAGPTEYPLPIQVLRIGTGVVGTMPHEVFAEIGLEFKERCGPGPAQLTSLAHGYYGYLPTPRQHDLGGYETWLGTNRVERDASVKLLAGLLELHRELAPPTQP